MKSILIAFLLVLFLSSCATNKVIQDKTEINRENESYIVKDGKKIQTVQTVQTDRYTLVELEDPTKNYVLDQIIYTSIPRQLSISVKDGMEYLLNQSGYSLCSNEIITVLYDKKLPKIHYKIGPVKLNDALQILAGKAWLLTVDHVEREVCFKLNEGYHIKQNKFINTKKEKEGINND